MKVIHAESVDWTDLEHDVREAKLFSETHGETQTQVDLVEVGSGGYIPPHRHKLRREFLTILFSAGAQIQIGDRVFRPVAGQVFEREPGDILALTNDTTHPFRFSVVRLGFDAMDVEWVEVEPTEANAS